MRLFPGLVLNEPVLRTARYAAILGESPSKGARSPHLWNAVFAAEGMDCEMLPLDCTTDALPALVKGLQSDDRFIGGACAMPHKSELGVLLGNVEPEARKIGAVNAMCRVGGTLLGLNTDGRAAVTALQAYLGRDLSSCTVTLIGLGGAGSAVAVFLAGAARLLNLCSRDSRRAAAMAAQLAQDNCRVVAWPLSADVLSRTDVLVNCTSVGHEAIRRVEGGHTSLRLFTPLAEFADPLVPGEAPGTEFYTRQESLHQSVLAEHLQTSRALLAALPDSATVYDIVYQPLQTTLLRLASERGLRTLNGAAMNLEQAVIAFARAVPELAPVDRVRETMRRRAAQL
jgi:shikimate dehydrogenase